MGTLRRGKGCGAGRTYIVGHPCIPVSIIRLVVDHSLHLLQRSRSIEQINNVLPIPRIDVAVRVVVLFVGWDSSVVSLLSLVVDVVVRRGVDSNGAAELWRLLGIVELIKLSVGGRG